MKRVFALLAVISVGVLTLISVAASAQDPQPLPEPVVVHAGTFQEPVPAPPAPPGNTFVFIASEMGFGGKTVKGAPYSAEATTETIQTLADGNRIVNRMTSTLYRDSEGRTRREQTLKQIANYSGEPIQTIFINDPVTGVSYALDSNTHTAHKSMPLKFEQKMFVPGVVPGAGIAVPNAPDTSKFEFKIESKRIVKPEGTTSGPPGEPPQVVVRTEGGSGGDFVFARTAPADNKNIAKESLGTQLIEGVQAEGTRFTATIPAGEIGNERPIEIVTERWYSSELQMVVMSKHSDPRTGETTYKLTNINRTEPAKSLFEVPAGYTISEGLPWKQAPVVPAKPKKPGNPE